MKFRSVFMPFLGALLSAQAAFAADAFDYHCADVALLQMKEVQKEVGITEAQRAKMNAAADIHRTRIETYDQQQRAAKVKDTQSQQRTKLKGFYDELKKGVASQLTATQLKRVRELTLQRAGLTALLDRVVAKRVGFTEAQTEKYRKTFGDGAGKASALEQQTLKPILDRYQAMKPKTDAEKKKLEADFEKEVQAAGKKIAPQLEALKNDTQKKLEAMFTPSHKSVWKSLLGKPFKPTK